MIRALILTDSYYDKNEEDNDVLVRPSDGADSVILEAWPKNFNGVQIAITREELLAILNLIPVE